MTNRLWQSAIDRAGVLAAPFALDDLPDAELHQRFISHRDEAAFAALVRRHGPLVWSVCRSLLGSEADAEDAFQATFLVLVRSAKKANKPNVLGAWLHTVAGRVCRNSLRSLARRKKHERNAAVADGDQPIDAAAWERWQALAHEEIDRLPESLRVPFVLCVLQGVRQPDAAKQLGWKLGTVSGRVCRAKQVLTEALSRRGVAASFAVGLGSATMPLSAALGQKGIGMVRFGTGSNGELSGYIHELARGAMGGIMTKTKLLATAIVVGTLAVGVGSQLISRADAQPAASPPGVGGGFAPGTASPAFPGGLGGGSPGSTPPGFPGGAGGGGAARSSFTKVEYLFVAKQSRIEDFKNTLTKRGEDGWEFAGLVPGTDELIFKRGNRAMAMGGMGSSMGMPGMPAMGEGSSASPPPTPSGMGPVSPAPMGGPVSGSPGGGPPPGMSGDTLPSGPAGGGGASVPSVKRAEHIDLQVGETTRYAMASSMQIKSLVSNDSKVVEVTLDPLDARRIVIRTLAPGVSKLVLTDSLGAKETYSIRVK